jgi:hypothetical protein
MIDVGRAYSFVAHRCEGESAGMEALIKFFQRLENGVERRSWLLYEALRSAPLDEAIELACKADAFIVGTADDGAQAQRAGAPEPDEPTVVVAPPKNPPQGKERSNPKGRLSLSADQRDRMLDRLAAGTKNADIAEEFGLSPQQVQGVRIGSAREIAVRRARMETEPLSESTSVIPVQEVVRYLRQQDDIVVPQEDGHYLVNGRFRLRPDELVDRANRMRSRKGKPDFGPARGHSSGSAKAHRTNEHPLFWDTSGSDKPDTLS